MRIAVVGAGVAGLSTAIFCARDGHEVVLLERDATPLPQGPDEAFEWQRRGAPQVRHSHAFLARLRNLLRDELPEVREDLLASGALEVRWADMVPDTLGDVPAEPEDEDLVMLACRRTTFEWVLRRAALGTDRVELRDGAVVTGLSAANGSGPLRIVGVDVGGQTIEADAVVDATGRTSRLVEMLARHDVCLPIERSDTGIVYLSRFYRLCAGAVEPDPQPLNGGDLGHLKFAVFRGDNGTFSVTLAFDSEDTSLRGLREQERFEAVCSLIPIVAPWVDGSTSAPITDVHFMGGLINRVRRFVDDDRPAVLGLFAVGDASVCTNPLYGRGCALGAVHGWLLAHALRDADDAETAALAFHDATSRELVPWYEAAVAQDEVSKRVQRGEQLEGQEAFFRSVIAQGLLPAARTDAVVNRAWVRTFNLLSPPDTMLTTPDLINRIFAVWQERESNDPELAEGPTRDEVLAVLAEGRAG